MKNKFANHDFYFQEDNTSRTVSEKMNLFGMNKEEIFSKLSITNISEKEKKMRTSQIWSWIYTKGVRNFEEMSNISLTMRKKLSKHFSLDKLQLAKKKISVDGTIKYLLRCKDKGEIETVFIPEKNRGTLCISSQIGCTLNCSFCFTGTQKLFRNLTSEEIIGQIIYAMDDLKNWKNENKRITNIVLMGMGEPLYNYEEVKKSIKIMMNDKGLAISKRKITLSTSGVIPYIHKISDEIGCMLAISLHATTDKLRDQLVPINKKWNIKDLFENLRSYPGLSNSNRITFEYVMLKNINDSDQDAKRLVKLISGIPAKINLIPFNNWPDSNFKRSSDNRILAFSKIVIKAGYSSPVRKTRGDDISAACGQLKSISEKKKRVLNNA